MLYRVENIVKKENCLFQQYCSHNVFHSYISIASQNAALCDNGLNSLHITE